MTTYVYYDFDFDEFGNDITVQREIDDVDILDYYWDYWCELMQEKYPTFRKDEMDFMSKSHCIDNWITLNWVKEKK
jgi:hypothetical protein